MRRAQCVRSKCVLRLGQHELIHYIPFGKDVVDSQKLCEAGESFVQPQIIPPLHRYQITEPLTEKKDININRNVVKEKYDTISACILIFFFNYYIVNCTVPGEPVHGR